MASWGSEAYRLEQTERDFGRELEVEFGVVEGGGIDAQVRSGVSHEFIVRVGLVVAALMLFVSLGALRVFITTGTVSHLRGNVTLRSDIKEAEQVNADLRIERSVLSSSSRISRIAVQNYGMVPTSSYDHIALVTEEEAEAEAAMPEVQTALSDDAMVQEADLDTTTQQAAAGEEGLARAQALAEQIANNPGEQAPDTYYD